VLNNLSAALSVSDLAYILSGGAAVLWAKLYLHTITWKLAKMFSLAASSLAW